MRKTNRPEIAGILALTSGVLASFGAVNYDIGLIQARGFGQGDMPPFVPSLIYGVPELTIVVAVFAMAGGVLAVWRKRWQWSLAGSIAAALSVLPLGAAAMVLIALSRDEFDRNVR